MQFLEVQEILFLWKKLLPEINLQKKGKKA